MTKIPRLPLTPAHSSSSSFSAVCECSTAWKKVEKLLGDQCWESSGREGPLSRPWVVGHGTREPEAQWHAWQNLGSGGTGGIVSLSEISQHPMEEPLPQSSPEVTCFLLPFLISSPHSSRLLRSACPGSLCSPTGKKPAAIFWLCLARMGQTLSKAFLYI